MTKISDILAAVPTLDDSEIAKLEQRIKARKALADDTPPLDRDNPVDFGEMTLIVNAMRMAWRDSGRGDTVLPNLHRYIKEGCQDFLFYISKNVTETQRSALVSKNVTETQRAALAYIGFQLLIKDRSARGKYISQKTLLLCAGYIPDLIDKAFPGYAESGWLSWVVKNHKLEKKNV